ncbi:hypothetical protein [Variovorax sp. JS1663]|uniref:hypothetical protein n=1 Tax=Variovorax sp. JS1663 TaxID=1851577 RepID=UPI000B765C0E|nr:hypothetical protein [Variovorax sp. JS1663]OUM00415.1 hypothetical protein A8M77_21410 [Variovorax sp. JS1663]
MKDRSGSIRTSIQGPRGRKVLPSESSAVEVVAPEVGIEVRTLERWRGRLEAVIATAAMPESGKCAWCCEHGVYPAELDKRRSSPTIALAEPEEARASLQATPARPQAHQARHQSEFHGLAQKQEEKFAIAGMPTMATRNCELLFMLVLSTLISIQWTFFQPKPLMSFQTVV